MLNQTPIRLRLAGMLLENGALAWIHANLQGQSFLDTPLDPC
jgi:hypothetical protein